MTWTHNAHIAPGSSHCLRVRGWASSAASCSATSSRVRSSGTATRPTCSPRACRTGCWMLPRFGMTSSPSTATPGATESTSSQQDSRVNRSRSQEVNSRVATRATDGRPRPASSARYDRRWCGWKTSQASLLDPTGTSSASPVTWSRSGMIVSGRLYPLPRPELRTVVNGGGACVSTPTPTATDSKGSRNATANRTAGSNHNGGVTLTDYVTMWPIPVASDWKRNGCASEQKRDSPNLPARVGGRLNPQWVEWLMGVPIGWTDCAPLETGKSPHNSFWHGVISGAKRRHGDSSEEHEERMLEEVQG